MADTTEIGWTNHSFNPWWGCEKVSPACAHCYAERDANRHQGPGLWGEGHRFKFQRDAYWEKPAQWNQRAKNLGEPKLVFCASMADVFEDRDEIRDERERLWETIAETPWLIWQLLTKRPENVMGMVPALWDDGFPSNVWVGASIENQAYTWRADELREIPAPLRFLSCEPLLASLLDSGARASDSGGGETESPSLETRSRRDARPRRALDLTGIGWIISGGESGPRSRLSDPNWFRELRDVCAELGIPYFFKQWGGRTPKAGGKVLDGREWCEIPERPSPRELALF